MASTNQRKIADLQALCSRSHSILSEHWGNYMDEEGYGPSTLLRDLEKASKGKEVRDVTLLNEQLHKALEETLAANRKIKKAVEDLYDNCDSKILHGWTNTSADVEVVEFETVMHFLDKGLEK